MGNKKQISRLSEVGERGFVFHYDDKYYAVVEDDWRQLDLHAVPAQDANAVGVLTHYDAAVAVMSEAPPSVFVNLERFVGLEETEGSKRMKDLHPSKALGDLPREPCVVAREANSVVVIPKSEWQPIDGDVAGDAKVLVYRGALAASIPQQDIPTGTFCVLVNFAGLIEG